MQKVNSVKSKPIKKSEGFLTVDREHCAACRSCMYACALSHDGVAALDLARIQVTYLSGGIFDACAEPCMQCDDPLCMRNCPKDAIYADPVTGARVVNPKKCIGCQRCIQSCPYDPPRIRFDTVRTKAVKCDLCGGNPQCVRVCPNGSLTYQKTNRIKDTW